MIGNYLDSAKNLFPKKKLKSDKIMKVIKRRYKVCL